MAWQIYEAWESGDGGVGKSAQERYRCIVYSDNPAADGDDSTAAANALKFAIPHFSAVSPVGNVLVMVERERLLPSTYLMTGTYQSPTADRQTDTSSFSFSTAGGSQHISNSRQTVQGYGVTGGAPVANYGGAINVSETSVGGVDIDVRGFTFKTTFYVNVQQLTQDYVRSLFTLSGRVNNDSVTLNVRGIQIAFQPGELRFLYAEGSERAGFQDWELTLNWSALPNESDLTIGPITGIQKNGWDYLWVDYENQKDAAAKKLIVKPIAVYVERVYDYQALNPLLLPTDFGTTNTPPGLGFQVTPGGFTP